MKRLILVGLAVFCGLAVHADGVSTSSPVYSVGSVVTGVFPYSSTCRSTVVGFSQLARENFDCDSYPYTLTLESIPDAEKTSGSGVDYTWCQQLTDVDLLTYGGYATAAGFSGADALADYLRANPSIAEEDVIAHILAKGGYQTANARSFLPISQGNGALLNALKNGFADGKSLASVGLLFMDGKGNGVIHVVALCGYALESFYDESDPRHLCGIYYIDPDDDKCATPSTAPNRIRYCDLIWDSTENRYVAQRDFSWGGIDYSAGALYCDGESLGYFLKKLEKSVPTSCVIQGKSAAGSYSCDASLAGAYTLTSSGFPDWIKSLSVNVGNFNYKFDASLKGSVSMSISGTGTISADLAENTTGAAREFTWTIDGRNETSPVTVKITQQAKSEAALPNFAFAKPTNPAWPAAAFSTGSEDGTEVKSSFTKGETAYVRFCIHNYGSGVAAGGETVSVALDGDVVGEPVAGDVLQAGASRLSSVEIGTESLAAGTHEVLLSVNGGRTISESNYEDNVVRVTFTVVDASTPVPTSCVIQGKSAAGSYSCDASLAGAYTLTSSGFPDWIKSLSVNVGGSNYNLDASMTWTLNVSISGTGTISANLAENTTGAAREFTWTIGGRNETSPVTVKITQAKSGDKEGEYTITYLNTKGAGNPNPDTYTLAGISEFKALTDVAGYKFAGWTPSSIPADTAGSIEVTANWTTDSDPLPASTLSSATTYDAMVYDASFGLVGTVQVKLGKAKNGVSKITATIAVSGKKTVVKGSFTIADGTFSGLAKDGTALSLSIGDNDICGSFGNYTIDGARNVASNFDAYKGSYTMVFAEESGWSGLSITIAAKGKVKVSGTLMNGKKISATTQLIAGDDVVYAPVVITKNDQLSFVFYLFADGDTDVTGLGDAIIAKVGVLEQGATFACEDAISSVYPDDVEVLDDYLPDGLSVEVSGSKWIVDGGNKIGKLVWDKKANDGDGDINEEKSKIDGYNVSGLKLTYSAKAGTFKGSFKVYTIVKGALKSTTASVSGVVVDGVGYGSATVKKYGSVPVLIE